MVAGEWWKPEQSFGHFSDFRTEAERNGWLERRYDKIGNYGWALRSVLAASKEPCSACLHEGLNWRSYEIPRGTRGYPLRIVVYCGECDAAFDWYERD